MCVCVLFRHQLCLPPSSHMLRWHRDFNSPHVSAFTRSHHVIHRAFEYSGEYSNMKTCGRIQYVSWSMSESARTPVVKASLCHTHTHTSFWENTLAQTWEWYLLFLCKAETSFFLSKGVVCQTRLNLNARSMSCGEKTININKFSI